jgi:hypothetical protein
MMSYIEMPPGVLELISIAMRFRGSVGSYGQEMERLIATVEELDHPGSFPADSFSEQFYPQYRGDGEVPNDVALRQAARDTAKWLDMLATNLPAELFKYLTTDVTGAEEIHRGGQD